METPNVSMFKHEKNFHSFRPWLRYNFLKSHFQYIVNLLGRILSLVEQHIR